MSQIKEKAPAAPASVTSANLNNQVKNTTKKLIRQAECASEVSQTYPAKATYQISEYLEYCDYVGKQFNPLTIEFIGLPFESSQCSEKTREEQEIEIIKKIEKLSPENQVTIIDLVEFMVWKNQ